jgi:hypothetical protein
MPAQPRSFIDAFSGTAEIKQAYLLIGWIAVNHARIEQRLSYLAWQLEVFDLAGRKKYRNKTDAEIRTLPRKSNASRARKRSWSGSPKRQPAILTAWCARLFSRRSGKTCFPRSSASIRHLVHLSGGCIRCCALPTPAITGACCRRYSRPWYFNPTTPCIARFWTPSTGSSASRGRPPCGPRRGWDCN